MLLLLCHSLGWSGNPWEIPSLSCRWAIQLNIHLEYEKCCMCSGLYVHDPLGYTCFQGYILVFHRLLNPPPLVHLANTVLCELTYKAALPRHFKQLWKKWRYKTDVCNYVEQVPNLSWVGKRFYYCYQYYLYYVEQASGSGAIRQSTAAKQTADGARCCRLLPTADRLWSAC